MHTNLPIISSTGIFHSSDKFSDPVKYPDGSVTRIRTVVDYELELYTEDGGQLHTNGVTHSIHKGDLMLADDSGVCIVPPEIAADVLEECLKIAAAEERMRELIEAGAPISELRPLFRSRYK